MKTNLLNIFALLLFTGGLVVGISFWVGKSTAKPDISASLLKSFADKDADHDGLNDNLESIYGTDYNNPDSDGDGYLDGEEVLSGYDPRKPAPDDKLDAQYAVIPRPAAGSMKDLNFTEDLLKKLASGVINSDIQPQKFEGAISLANPGTVEEALEAAAQRSYQEFSLPAIPNEQLDIALKSDSVEIKNYADRVSLVLEPINNFSALEVDEGLKNIGDLVNLCESAAVKIKQIKVPASLVAVHKKQIGLLVVQANMLKAVANAQNDILKANIAIAQIENINNMAIEILEEIQIAVESNG